MYKYSTNKGKSAVSYIRINGVIISTWIYENGGYAKTTKEFEEAIADGFDMYMIAKRFNISHATCKNYIKKYLSKYYIEKQLSNFKNNSPMRRSKSRKINSTKGKTYKQIYGTDTPPCGFKKGSENPNFTRPKYVGCTKISKYGLKFRSSYEIKFSELLTDNNIKYSYEKHFNLLNGKVKIVDFVVGDILVEVTGYAYEAWRNDFDAKVFLLHQAYPDKHLLIISTVVNIDRLSSIHGEYSTVLSIDNTRDIIDYLNLRM